jgi:hypothetical protein
MHGELPKSKFAIQRPRPLTCLPPARARLFVVLCGRVQRHTSLTVTRVAHAALVNRGDNFSAQVNRRAGLIRVNVIRTSCIIFAV